MKIYSITQFSWRHLTVPVAFSINLLPAVALAASPWQVDDGSQVAVTKGYQSSEANDVALKASGQGSTLETSPAITFNLAGDSVQGANASNGATITLNKSQTFAKGANSRGAYVDGATLNVNGGAMTAEGKSGMALQGVKGAVITLNDTTLNAAGGTAYGASMNNSTLNMNHSDFNILSATNGINLVSDSEMNVLDSSITITDSNATAGILVRKATLNADQLILNSLAKNGLRLYGYSDAMMAQANIKNSNIISSGESAVLAMHGNGVFDNVTISNTLGMGINANVNSHLDLNGVRIETLGDALWVADDAATVTATGSEFTTTGDKAHAVSAQFGQTHLTDSTLSTTGAAGYGLYSEALVDANNVQVTTNGDKSAGAFAARGGTITMTDSTVQTHGAASSGLMTYAGSTLNANGVRVITDGDNAAAAMANGGTQNITNSDLHAAGTGPILAATMDNGTINVVGSTLTSDKGSAIQVNGATLNVDMSGGTTLNAGNNLLLDVMQNQAQQPGVANVAAHGMTLQGDIQADSVSDANLALYEQSIWTGSTQSGGQILLNDSQWTLEQSSRVKGLSMANGHADLSKTTGWSTLTVDGNLTGDGQFTVKTELGDDSSPTDKVLVKGSADGQYQVAVVNQGGRGAQTVNGINVVDVQGDSSKANFEQSGRIVAGQYEYNLVRGAAADNGRWYLVSSTDDPAPDNGGDDNGSGGTDNGSGGTDSGSGGTDNGSGGTDNGNNGNGGGTIKPFSPRLRPEGASYIANMEAANTMFVTRMHDRIGEPQFDAKDRQSSLWLRQVGGHNRWYDGSGQLRTTSNRYVVQLGGDVAQWQFAESALKLGVMAGYGHNKSHTTSGISGWSSEGQVNGYSGGLYATWFANDDTREGLYVDSWLLYSHFKNSVKGQNLAEETYDSHGLTASLESGYTLPLGAFTGSKGTAYQAWLQPQAQLVCMGVRAPGHREDNGTRMASSGDGNIMSRVGLRAALSGHDASDNGGEKVFQPFIEANWIHNTRQFESTGDGVKLSQAGALNVAEVKVGVEAKLTRSFTMWGNTAVQVGTRGYNDASAIMGLKYAF